MLIWRSGARSDSGRFPSDDQHPEAINDMSNPFLAPEVNPGFEPTESGEFRRISARPIERLTEAKQMLGDQYWLFVGICACGMLIGSIVPLGILMGPMMCGMYLCFRYRMNGIQVRC